MFSYIFCAMKKYLPHLIFVLLAFAVGYISKNVQDSAMIEWYPFLDKASLNPPGIVFAIVWPILYLLMGISAGMIWNTRSIYTWFVMFLFFIQLGLNLMWSVCFFYIQSPVMGLVTLSALIVIVALFAVTSYLIKKAAGLLNIPYILWLLFALYLNAYVVLMN